MREEQRFGQHSVASRALSRARNTRFPLALTGSLGLCSLSFTAPACCFQARDICFVA
jgi:hypothetical protein